MLCCVVLCCAAPRCSALCSDAPCAAVPHRTPPCRVVPCCGVAGRALLFRTALCRAVLCCVVGCHAVLRCPAGGCAAVCCAALCCAVLCCAMPCGWSIVPPARRGVASALVRLVGVLCESGAQVMCLAGGRWVWFGVVWLAGSALRGSRCAVQSVGSGGCPPVALPWGLCLGPVSSGGPCPQWCARFRGLGWHGPTALLVPLPSGSAARAVASVWCPLQWKVGGVVAWQLGCGGGLCCALGCSLWGCTPLFVCGCTPLPLCVGRRKMSLISALIVLMKSCRY